jgi:hypothetical protein
MHRVDIDPERRRTHGALIHFEGRAADMVSVMAELNVVTSGAGEL